MNKAIQRPGQIIQEETTLGNKKLVINQNPSFPEVVYPKAYKDLGKAVLDYYNDKALVKLDWGIQNKVTSFYVGAQNGNTLGGAVFWLNGKDIAARWSCYIGYGATVEEALQNCYKQESH